MGKPIPISGPSRKFGLRWFRSPDIKSVPEGTMPGPSLDGPNLVYYEYCSIYNILILTPDHSFCFFTSLSQLRSSSVL